MSPERLIAARYLRSKHAYGFISLIGYLGMTGLAIGVAALILTLSVMRGFTSAVEDKVAAMDGHLRLANAFGTGMPIPDSVYQVIASHPAVVSITPYLTSHALIRKGTLTDGVLLMGADFHKLQQAIDVNAYLTTGTLPQAGATAQIILGEKLAQSLHVSPGEKVYLFDIGYILENQGIRGQTFNVAGTYRSGMVEYDELLAFTALDHAQELFGIDTPPSRAIINLVDRNQAGAVAAELEQQIGYSYYLTSWKERHAGLFAWLTGQQFPILVIFGFIALVALLNILSTLGLVVLEKQRDIGILGSLGFSRRRIRKIFFYQGGLVGLIGTVAGIVLALALGLLQQKLQVLSLDSDIYFMDALPVMWSWEALAGIPLIALGLTILMSGWPARKAAAISPAESLRYE